MSAEKLALRSFELGIGDIALDFTEVDGRVDTTNWVLLAALLNIGLYKFLGIGFEHLVDFV